MRLAIILAILIVSATAAAEPYKDPMTAQDLLNLCQGQGSAKMECTAFIKGVRSGAFAQRLFIGFTFVRHKIDPPNMLKPLLLDEPFCVPSGFTDEAVVNTVVNFIKAMPTEDRKGAAGFTVILALNSRYGC